MSSDARLSNRQRGDRFGQRTGTFSGQNGPNNQQPGGDSTGAHQYGKVSRGKSEYQGYKKARELRGTKVPGSGFNMLSNSLECQMTWEDMNLNTNITARIAKAGLDNPSNVQKLIMKPFMQGKDVIAQSQSQYDRTCTLAIALLQKLSPSASTHKHCQVLVVCSEGVKPQQVHEDFQSWFEATPELGAVLLSPGETAVRTILSDPDQAKQVVLTTLGPLMEALRSNLLDINDIKTVVFSMQEAELVELQPFKQLWALLTKDTQVILMTGRITQQIQEVKSHHFRDDTAVRRADELTLQWSEHYYVGIPSSDRHQRHKAHGDHRVGENMDEAEPAPKDRKWEVLMEILTKNPDISHTVILTQSQSQTQALTSKLKARQFNVVSVWSMADRVEVTHQFNRPDPCIIVSESTLMDCDLDYSSLVINYDMPMNATCYITSFGPFGRSGLRTLMINFCVMDDSAQRQTLEAIKSMYDISILEMERD
ncbi:translation initiation factor eIF4A [Modicella reniformis]|uniref:Translation initiation factor eIF4A n=1 Tax=Modicella reniformis TaxID=1440133 RepID=A0A9P6LSN8_9FUNG|nr:translation initiation factor eIF4A [Modicella reniformis]